LKRPPELARAEQEDDQAGRGRSGVLQQGQAGVVGGERWAAMPAPMFDDPAPAEGRAEPVTLNITRVSAA
jgi:hypothetical protein